MVVLVTFPELKPLGEGGDVYGEEVVGGEPTPGTPRRRASEEIKPADSSILDFQSSKLDINVRK